ncbi:MAG: zinc-binding dehydrogenase [Thermoleophilia bacterium]|nr:zinc-binding dehydrogenase [Thermoleophilia bacterium]
MKAVRIHEDGGPEVLRYEDAPDPVPGPAEVLVRLRAASLNRLDLWTRSGRPAVPKPRILGADGAGVVEALGPGARRFAPGDEVVLNPGLEDGRQIVGEHCDGTHAELIAVSEEYVEPKPAHLSFVEAAAFPLVWETAYRMLVTRAGLRAGEWVLCWGIGSGVGSAAFQLARALGARVAVTSSSEGKLERALELGADVALNHATADVPAAVREATGGRGADIVVEHVGEATWKASLEAACFGGRIVVTGATSGANPPAGLARIWWKQLTILGSTMATREDFRALLRLVSERELHPLVDRVYPLAAAADAHRRLERGEQLGKIVLEIGG